MKKIMIYIILLALVLVPFSVVADSPAPNCGLDLGSSIRVNVSDTVQKEFYILGDTEALLNGGDQSTSVIRLISKDNILDNAQFNTEAVEYKDSDIKASIEEEVKEWRNVSSVGLLTESDLNYYFGLDGTNHLPSSVNKDFLKASSANDYWTSYIYKSGTDQGKVIAVSKDGEITKKATTGESAVRVVVEMPLTKACSASGGSSADKPHGEENAKTGDLDLLIYVGAAAGLLMLANYSYKKKNA